MGCRSIHLSHTIDENKKAPRCKAYGVYFEKCGAAMSKKDEDVGTSYLQQPGGGWRVRGEQDVL